MKKFTVPCDFGGKSAPFTIYIGDPEPNHHPLHFQADWLSKERGGTIPSEVMDSIAKLYELAKKNNVSFEELCVYALNSSKDEEGGKETASKETEDFGEAPTPGGAPAALPPVTPDKKPAEEDDFLEDDFDLDLDFGEDKKDNDSEANPL